MPYTQYPHRGLPSASADTTSKPSASIWADCPIDVIATDPRVGYGFFDDFVRGPASDGPYNMFGDTVPVPLAAFQGGAMSMAGGAVDNHQSGMGAASDAFVIDETTAANSKKLWFEARIRPNEVADQAIFVGLTKDQDQALDFLADGGLTISALADFVGFTTISSDSDQLDFSHGATGVAYNYSHAVVKTFTANLWMKVGFVYDPDADTAKRVTLFLDGVEQTTYVTGAQIEATNFPEVGMAPFITQKTGEAVAKTVDIDWWGCYQLR